jgi:hypothetical protein
MVTDALWSLSYLADSAHAGRAITMMAESGSVAFLMQYVDCKDARNFVPALRAIGNICSSDEHIIIDTMVELKLLQNLHKMMHSCSVNIKKEICWVISNLMAGVSTHVDKFVESPLLPLVFEQCHS